MAFLLERLAAPAERGREFDLEAAVAAQIQRIVAARTLEADGGAPSLLEFGMPNVADLGYGSKSTLERYGARLKRLVEHYEPRLLHPEIAVEATGNALLPHRLVVSGSLQPDGETRSFVFELPEH